MACLGKLKEETGVELMVCHWPGFYFNGEEYGFILPPSMSYGETLLPGMQDSSYTHLVIRIETIEAQSDVYGDEQSSINSYIPIFSSTGKITPMLLKSSIQS